MSVPHVADRGEPAPRRLTGRARLATFAVGIGMAVAVQAQPASFQLALNALQMGDCKRGQTMETIDYPESAIQARAETSFQIDVCSPHAPPTIVRALAAAVVSAQLEADFRSALVEGLQRTYRALPPPKLDTAPDCARFSTTFFIERRHRPRP